MFRPVAAFIAVATEADTGNESEVRIEQPEKVQRQAVFRRPAIRRADAAGLEGLSLRLVAEADAVFTVRTEAELYASVRVDLKVEIALVRAEGEEKLHAAVLMDGAERRAVFSADSRFPRLLADVKRCVIITELLRHVDAAVWLPEDRIDCKNRDGAPVRSTVNSWDVVHFHSVLPPR